MKSGLVIISVAVGAGAVLVDQLDELCVDDCAISALLRRDGRGGTAEMEAGVVGLGVAQAVGRREVPLFARSQTLHGLSVLDDAEVTDVVLSRGARAQSHRAGGRHAGTLLLTTENGDYIQTEMEQVFSERQCSGN